MTMKKQQKRHFFRHLVCAVLSFLLTASLLVTTMVGVVGMLLFDRGLHERTALSDAVIDAQMKRLTAEISEICDEYSVSEEMILPLVTRESVTAYNREVISWWMGMYQGGGVAPAPEWQAADLETAVREDEMFQSAVSSAQRKMVARDRVAPAIRKAISDAVLPVRDSLLSFAMAKIVERIDLAAYAGILYYAPLASLAVSALLTALICLVFKGRPRRRALWGSSPFMAAAFVVIGALALLALLNIPAQVAEMSEILAMQVAALMRALYLRMALTSAVCLLGGAAWMHLAYRASRRGGRKILKESKA